MSALGSILDAVVTGHTAAALDVNGNALTVVKRKLPKREETVDGSYQVTVSGAELVDTVKRIAFGSAFSVVYRVEMTLIVPNNHDQLTNLDAVANWREATRARYMLPNPINVAGVKGVALAGGVFLDRKNLSEGYDYTQVVIDVTTYETRSS